MIHLSSELNQLDINDVFYKDKQNILRELDKYKCNYNNIINTIDQSLDAIFNDINNEIEQYITNKI
jgi:hypothetical protein